LGVTNGTILDPKCDILFTPEVGLGRDEAMRRREFIKLIGGGSGMAAYGARPGYQEAAVDRQAEFWF